MDIDPVFGYKKTTSSRFFDCHNFMAFMERIVKSCLGVLNMLFFSWFICVIGSGRGGEHKIAQIHKTVARGSDLAKSCISFRVGYSSLWILKDMLIY